MVKEVTIITIIALALLGFTAVANTTGILDFLEIPLETGGLGNLCDSEEDCNEFCLNSRGLCEDFCESNPETKYCNILYSEPPQ